jgi:uncharacterized membrane protein YqiK
LIISLITWFFVNNLVTNLDSTPQIKLVDLVVVPSGKLGLIYAQDGQSIPVGRILGRYVESQNFQDSVGFLTNGGQKGRQANYITAGKYRINTDLFTVSFVDILKIKQNTVGIVTTLDGDPIPSGEIAGKEVDNHNNFQNIENFLNSGGNRGLQSQVILAGTYNINPWFALIEEVPMTDIPIGTVGVVISYIGGIGVDLTGDQSLRLYEDGLRLMEPEKNQEEVAKADIYLTIIMRRNSAIESFTPFIEEYMLLVATRDSTRFEGSLQ